jgi:hypothetical protein
MLTDVIRICKEDAKERRYNKKESLNALCIKYSENTARERNRRQTEFKNRSLQQLYIVRCKMSD